jgi:AcrR family transcriptional regulator
MSEKQETRKRILLAFKKLKRDAGPEGKGPSISAVAREAGVSHTLIHTKYSDIAEEIRVAGGRGPKQQLERQRENLQVAEERSAQLRDELAELRELNRGLASENARLTLLAKRLEQEIAARDAGALPLRRRPTRSGGSQL